VIIPLRGLARYVCVSSFLLIFSVSKCEHICIHSLNTCQDTGKLFLASYLLGATDQPVCKIIISESYINLWGRASLFMGAQLGNLEWAHLPGTLTYDRNGLRRWSVSLCGSSVKGSWREDSLAGDPEGYEEKALEAGISFHRGPV